MNRTAQVLFLNCSLFLIAGCGQAIRVTHAPANAAQPAHLDGIPFYTKVGACKHQTVWLEPTYKISMSQTYKVDGKDVTELIGMRTLSFEDYKSDSFRDFVLLFEKKNTAMVSEADILKAFGKFKNYASPYDVLPSKENRLLASNTNELTSYVNYGELYYYNVKKPLAGSVTASAELNTDGTLSKGTATIEDKTLQTFLDLVPVKDVVTAGAKAGLGILAVDGQVVALKLTIEPQTYQYTLYTTGAINPPLPCAPPGQALTSGSGEVNFARTAVGTESAKKDEESKAVKFSGSVEVPK